MSLKDRLNPSQQSKSSQNSTAQEQPKYYTSEVEANINSLGILDTILADDDINSIFISGAKNIYLEKKGKISKSTTTFRDNVQFENLLKKIASNEGFELNEFNPYFSFNYKLGINVSTTVPPLSNIPSLFIKCYKDKYATLQILQEELSISKEIALVLEALCTIKKNILITGSVNSLKTTLLSALAKKTTSNNKAIIIDSENEFKISGQNYTNYDFSKITDEKIEKNLLSSIVRAMPDKLVINTQKDSILSTLLNELQNGYKGAIISICSDNPQNAIEKFAYLFTKNNPYISFEKARALILGTFDIIISTSKDMFGRRKINTISQINVLNGKFIEDIFTLEYNRHMSKGIIPLFFEDIKSNSLPIGENIFDVNYKHTYHKGMNLDNDFYLSRKANVDVLKKFKKNLPTSKDKNETENDIEEIFRTQTEEEVIEKAQEKIEALKKIAQSQNENETNCEVDNIDFQDNSTDINENTNND